MKAILVTNEGYGAVYGRLTKRDEITYENEGKLCTMHLVGNVIETEYNDIIALGRKMENGDFEVFQMESAVAGYGFQTLNHAKANCTVIPACIIEAINEKVGKQGKPYKEIIAKLTNGKLHVILFGEYKKPDENGLLIIISAEPIRAENKTYGEGYAVKTVVTGYLTGYQILS